MNPEVGMTAAGGWLIAVTPKRAAAANAIVAQIREGGVGAIGEIRHFAFSIPRISREVAIVRIDDDIEKLRRSCRRKWILKNSICGIQISNLHR